MAKITMHKSGSGNAVDAAIRIGLLFILLAACFQIIKPFVAPVVWGMILAVALYPLNMALHRRGLSTSLGAVFITSVGLAMVLIPGVYIGTALTESTAELVTLLQSGEFRLPAPPLTVKEWPLIGPDVYQTWLLANQDLERFLSAHAEQIISVTAGVAGFAGGAIVGVLVFCFSIIISGVFIAKAEACAQGARLLAVRMLGERGEAIVSLAGGTIQSVAKGVLGVAVIQTALISVGFFAVGLKLAPALSILVLILAIAQLPPTLVVLPVVIFVFYTEPTWIAILFTIWSVLAGLSENVLKPMLLGRGVDVPMLVILLGSLGGMLMAGFVGLFLGAVILAVGYRLLVAWVTDEQV